MTKLYNWLSKKTIRRTLRKNLPPSELILWSKLKGKQMDGYKFRRQYGIGPFVVDFYCVQAKLAIELDGETHYVGGAQEYDQRRGQFLRSSGITVIRFLNTEVRENLQGVLAIIASKLGRTNQDLPEPLLVKERKVKGARPPRPLSCFVKLRRSPIRGRKRYSPP